VLPLLEDASSEEKDLFGSLRWHRARVSVHRDRALMPDREEAWGAYNYVLCEGDVPEIRPTITFYPAKLAGLAGAEGIFVTMNPFREPDPDMVVANYFLSHPAAGSGGELAAARVAQIQGIRNCWYCGSYLVQPWVHEPALATGVDLAETMRQRIGSREAERLPYLDDLLASIPLFAGLDPFAIADVGLAADRFAAAAGETLFRQDDTADGVYVVASGKLALNARMPGDREIELARVGAGELIGEFCLLDDGRRSAEAVALEPTLGYRIDLARFGALRASERPAALEVLGRLRSEVARRTRTTIETIAASLDQLAAPRPAAASPAPAGDGETGDCAALLGSFPGFEGFSLASWRELDGLVSKTVAARGTRLEAPGKPVSGLHLVARGALRAGLPAGDGIEQLLIHGPGSIAGAAGLLDAGDWPLALDVREDAIVYTLDARDIAALRTARSPLAFKLFELVGRQLTADLRRLSRIHTRRESQLADSREFA
jgi:CRP/FNR family cyclic AMP-dependent transcriptional regulator